MIDFISVGIPTSLVTSNMFIDSIDAMNSEESSDIFPLDSADSAVFRMVLKNRSKFTKRLMGKTFPSLET